MEKVIPQYEADDIEEISTLRDGKFVNVKKIKIKSTEEILTMTKIKLGNCKLKPNPNIIVKLQKLYNLNHITLNKTVGFALSDSLPYVLCEYPQNGSLYEYIKSNQYIDSTTKLCILYGIACGMKALHSEGIIHSDLKAKSIYIDKDKKPIIGDFAPYQFITRVQKPETSIANGVWIAPELFKSFEPSQKSDVYAFGTLTHYLYSTKFNFGRKVKNAPFSELILSGARPMIPDSIPYKVKFIIDSCWRHRPNERPSFDQIITELLKILDFIFFDANLSIFKRYKEKLDKDVQITFENIPVKTENDEEFTFSFPEQSKQYNNNADCSHLNKEGRHYAAQVIHLQKLLTRINKENKEEIADAIVKSVFIKNKDLWCILVQNLFYLSRCYYRDLLMYAEFIANITDEVEEFKNYLFKSFFAVADEDNCFPERLPVVSTLYFLRNIGVYSNDDIVDQIENIYNTSPSSKRLLSILFCYFAPEIEKESKLYQQLMNLAQTETENCFFPAAFKNFFAHIQYYKSDNWNGLRNAIEKHVFVDHLKNIIVNDDYKALVEFIKHPEFIDTVKIESEIFDPCLLGHNKPNIGLIAPLYNSINCFQVLQLAHFDFTGKDNRFIFLPSFIVAGENPMFYPYLDKKNVDLDNTLQTATAYFKYDAFNYLTRKRKLDISKPDKFGQIVINSAVIAGNVDVLLYCLSNGVSVQQRENFGWAPLHWAAFKSKLPIVHILRFVSGINANIQDDWGLSPLHLAAEYGDVMTVKELLLFKQIDVNISDEKGRTPLHKAVEGGRIEIVKALLEDKRLDAGIKDMKGIQPSKLAIKRNRPDIAALIKQFELS